MPTIIKSSKSLKPLHLTYGGDPEMFLGDRQQGGRIVSAIPILEAHDKEHPAELGGPAKARLYRDNVLVECSYSPCPEDGDIVTHLRDVFRRMQERLGDRYQLVQKAAHEMEADQLNHPDALKIGCEPTYNTYLKQANDMHEFPSRVRTSSCHIHIGRTDWENPSDDRLMSIDSKEEVAHIMDVFVGCGGVITSRDETGASRRKLYGKAGEARFPAYGLEWRCLEGWFLSSPDLARLVWDLTGHAMSHVKAGTATEILKAVSPVDVQKAINTCDKPLARKVLKAASMPYRLMERVEAEYPTPGFRAAWGI